MSELSKRAVLVEALTQTIAPRLFHLCGDEPGEMGFPVGDSKDEFDARLERQFDPINYWTKMARQIASSLVNIIEAGGVDTSMFDYERAICAIKQERPDLDNAAQGVPPNPSA